MSDTEHQFDPHWPHGHLYLSDGETHEARIRLTDAAGNYPIVAEVFIEGEWDVKSLDVKGFFVNSRGPRLINRPAPGPVVVVEHGLPIVIEVPCPFVRRPGAPSFSRARIVVACEWLSDDSVRASAEVVK